MLRSKTGLAWTRKSLSVSIAVSPWWPMLYHHGDLCCITMVTYAFNQTWSGREQVLSSAEHSFLAPPLTPFWVSPRTSEPISYRGLSGDRGAFGTDTIPWHCLRIFFMRYTGSRQRVFATLLSLCRQCLLLLFLLLACGVSSPKWCGFVWSLKSHNSNVICNRYLFT